jgi:deazaflavin-dependent oxidoreductase (nitroreductase family)
MNFWQRLTAVIEPFIMKYLVGQRSPGPLFRWIFKIPLIFYRLGLGALIGHQILILTTTGRKSGKLRSTPLEYIYQASTDTFYLMAGWEGRTDWYRNVLHTPQIQVQVGKRTFKALAEPLPPEETAELLAAIARVNPRVLEMWSRWTAQPLDGSPESLLAAAPHFPTIKIQPDKQP